jgi:hypothetical protein
MSSLDFIQDGQGWRWSLVQAVKMLDDAAERAGLTLDPSHEPAYLDGHVAPLNPRYTSGRLTSRNFVHVLGSGLSPTQVATRSALRVYNWYDGNTLASESRALRVYYDHPEDAKHTEHAIFSSPIADRIQGRAAFNGAVWVHPDLRGPRDELGGAHVVRIVSSLSRFLALYLFDVDWCVATTPAKLAMDGLWERAGWAGCTGGLNEAVDGIHNQNCHLMWSRREDIIAEAEQIAAHGIADAHLALSGQATSPP